MPASRSHAPDPEGGSPCPARSFPSDRRWPSSSRRWSSRDVPAWPTGRLRAPRPHRHPPRLRGADPSVGATASVRGVAVGRPARATLAAEGGDPVIGQLGSFTWGDGGSDSPWLPGAPITVGPASRLTVTLADGVAIASWSARRVPAGPRTAPEPSASAAARRRRRSPRPAPARGRSRSSSVRRRPWRGDLLLAGHRAVISHIDMAFGAQAELGLRRSGHWQTTFRPSALEHKGVMASSLASELMRVWDRITIPAHQPSTIWPGAGTSVAPGGNDCGELLGTPPVIIRLWHPTRTRASARIASSRLMMASRGHGKGRPRSGNGLVGTGDVGQSACR